MRISIFGLGYVGSVTAACFARDGNFVIGVDTNTPKVEAIRRGESPVVEPDMGEILRDAVKGGRLKATSDPSSAILESDVTLICVGTPSRSNGSLNLDQIFAVADQIGKALAGKQGYHAIAVRSTVLPGTVEKVINIVSAASGKMAGVDFGVASNPEFLREGTAVADFEHPPYTILGVADPRTEQILRDLYAGVHAPLRVMDIRAAELLKYACNSFHALKVTFANEIGAVAKSLGVDSHSMMNVFMEDTKLNISPYYLRPGFAFGGSCLPKDVRALDYAARLHDVSTPLISAILPSNEQHIRRVVDWVLEQRTKKVGILGLSFKNDTDDMRESPIVRVVETLLGKGYHITIYDSNVNLSRLIGANKEFIEQGIPHISSLLKDSIEDVVDASDIIILANPSQEFSKVFQLAKAHQVIYDLVHIDGNRTKLKVAYEGVCW